MTSSINTSPLNYSEVAKRAVVGETFDIFTPTSLAKGTYEKATATVIKVKPATSRGKEVDGLSVEVKLVNDFGNDWTAHLFTTQEAEEAHHGGPPKRPNRMRIEDPNGTPTPLTRTFGTLATLAVTLPDIDPDEATRRIRSALEAEFGTAPTQARIMRLKGRPVPDVRVDVYSHGEERTPLAINVLESEASYLVPMPHVVSPAAASVIIGN